MAQVLIRNLPDAVIEAFKTKTRLEGTSLEQVLRELILRNTPFTAAEKLRLTEEYHRAAGGAFEPMTKDEIRDGLD